MNKEVYDGEGVEVKEKLNEEEERNVEEEDSREVARGASASLQLPSGVSSGFAPRD